MADGGGDWWSVIPSAFPAFLVATAARGQRLARAKAKIRDAGIAFAVPEAAHVLARMK